MPSTPESQASPTPEASAPPVAPPLTSSQIILAVVLGVLILVAGALVVRAVPILPPLADPADGLPADVSMSETLESLDLPPVALEHPQGSVPGIHITTDEGIGPAVRFTRQMPRDWTVDRSLKHYRDQLIAKQWVSSPIAQLGSNRAQATLQRLDPMTAGPGSKPKAYAVVVDVQQIDDSAVVQVLIQYAR